MQPDMIASAVHALQLLLEPGRLLILFVGVLIGLAIGVLPGLNGIVGMAMLIPFTYNLDEYTAFALLLGMATVIDGHAMARKGEAGRAFGAGFAASLAGGIVGAVVLAVSIPILRPVMLSIGSPELLAFTLFGMSMVATLSGRAPLKGLTAAGLGLMIAMIGSRAQSGTLRWTFGWLYLYDGVPLVPATFGTGDVRGVIAPESSNNAKEGGHLVPTIAFGVPAGASMAILLGAFLMHGLTPGPE